MLELQHRMGKRERNAHAWLERPYPKMKKLILKEKMKKKISRNHHGELVQTKIKIVFPVQFQTGKHTDKQEKGSFVVENKPDSVI